MIDTTQLNNDEINFLVYLCNTSQSRLVPIVTPENLPFQNRTFVENLLTHILDTYDYEEAKGKPDDWIGCIYRLNGMTSSFSINDNNINMIQEILKKWTD